MIDCAHCIEPHQYWDECVKCGARWNPEMGWNVPMNTTKPFRKIYIQTEDELLERFGKPPSPQELETSYRAALNYLNTPGNDE